MSPALVFDRKRVLVTGGSGFIGRYLVSALLKNGADISVLSRHYPVAGGNVQKIVMGDLTQPDTLKGICAGVDMIFHLGGYAHVVDQPDGKSAALNWRVTVEGTRFLLEEARRAGVHSFVYFSSVKAMGEGGEICLDETAESRPVTAYGKAKHEAEKLVLGATTADLATTVLRLPMVYGRGCKGNLPRMIQAVANSRFPPLPETGNRRSLVEVRDVVQAALLSATNAIAVGKVYIVTDNQIYSSHQIYRWICAALQIKVPRWTAPLPLLRLMARLGDKISHLSGRPFILDTDTLEKLIGSAWYSSEKIHRELNYRPIQTLENSLPEMIAEFRKNG